MGRGFEWRSLAILKVVETFFIDLWSEDLNLYGIIMKKEEEKKLISELLDK